MPPDRIAVSKRARHQLVALKRRTKIGQWNVLCRWALCRSLAVANTIADTKDTADIGVQMSWATFAGDLGEEYWAAVKQRCFRDGLDPTDEAVVENQFKLHLHRGIGYLSDLKLESIGDLLTRAASPPHK
jgi:DNA sulfur modification protein DndE